MIADLVAEHHVGWPGPWVEDELFGTHDPRAVGAALTACLDTPVLETVFYEASVGVVAGFVLADGCRIVVKVHRPGVPVAYLDAVRRVQGALAEEGFPCPRPLAGPRPLGAGIATVEELVDRGERLDAPALRRDADGFLSL